MSRVRILVIEDNPSDVFLLRRALFSIVGENFDLDIAADGEQALDWIHSRNGHHDPHPCVILLDLYLPKHDGIEILQALRKASTLNQIHVVVTTAMVSPKEAEQLRKLGVVYRPKPRDLSEVQQLASDLLALCHGSKIAA
jgi:two-component system response regulator